MKYILFVQYCFRFTHNFSFFTLLCVLQCCRRDVEEDDVDECRDHVEFASKNVHLITTMVSWEAKVSESIKDGKIVSLIIVVHIMLDSFLSYKGN